MPQREITDIQPFNGCLLNDRSSEAAEQDAAAATCCTFRKKKCCHKYKRKGRHCKKCPKC